MKNHYLKLLESFAATNPVAFLQQFAIRKPYLLLGELIQPWHVISHYAQIDQLNETTLNKNPQIFDDVFEAVNRIDSRYLKEIMGYFCFIVANTHKPIDLNLAKTGDIITIDDKEFIIKEISKVPYKREFLIFIEGEFQLHHAQDGSVITPSDFGAISCLKSL